MPRLALALITAYYHSTTAILQTLCTLELKMDFVFGCVKPLLQSPGSHQRHILMERIALNWKNRLPCDSINWLKLYFERNCEFYDCYKARERLNGVGQRLYPFYL